MLRFSILLLAGTAFAQQYTISTVAGGAPPATVETVYCCPKAVPANSRIENLSMRVVSPSDNSIMTF